MEGALRDAESRLLRSQAGRAAQPRQQCPQSLSRNFGARPMPCAEFGRTPLSGDLLSSYMLLLHMTVGHSFTHHGTSRAVVSRLKCPVNARLETSPDLGGHSFDDRPQVTSD